MPNGRADNLKLVVVAMMLVAAVAACKSTKQNLNKPVETSTTPAPASQSPFDVVDSKVIATVSPFDHSRKEHRTKTQDCAACHKRANNDAKPVLPGHSACIECHAKDFPERTSQMCVVCHKMPLDAQNSRIEFPTRLSEFGLKRFSHRDHANPEKMKGQMDAAQMTDGAPKCDACHRFDARVVQAGFPKHPECYSCHIHQPTEKLGDCRACHTKKADSMQYSAALGTAFSLYNFRHGPHLKKAACDKCHHAVEVAAEQPRSDVLRISTARGQRHGSECWSCHVRAREPVCSKCHISSNPF